MTESDTISLQAGRRDADLNASGAEVTVYFDGSCPLCTAEIRHYASCAGGDKLCFVDVSEEDADLGPDLAADAAMRRFHVRTSDGTLSSGARGFVAVWRTLPGWRWAARIASLPGVTAMLEVGYRLFLPIRPALSRLAARCGVKPARAQASMTTDSHFHRKPPVRAV